MCKTRFPFVALLTAFVLVTGCGGEKDQLTETSPGEWRQFRGPHGQGVSTEVGLPVRWDSDGKGVRWKTRIPGQGDSSPVVSRGRVFLTTAYGQPEDTREEARTRKALERVVVGLDLESGKILWRTPIFSGRKGKIHWLNTHATPTPATDGETLFVSFDSHLAALDFDGRILWKKDLDPDYYDQAHYGVASSPIVTDDAVILFQDREEGDAPDLGWLAAFDKRSGEELWRDEWDNTCCSYTTPVLVERGGRRVLLATTSQEANAYDPVTGSRLWQVPHRNTQPVPSAAVWGEYVTFPGAIHDALLSTFRLGPPESEPEPLWASRQAVPDIPSPVYFEGHLYAVTTSGVMTSFDPETGKVVRRQRLPSRDYRSALVAGDGKIYAVNDDGSTAVLKVDEKKFKLLRENKLGEGSGATPAIAGGRLLIRGRDHLFCVERKGSGDEAEA